MKLTCAACHAEHALPEGFEPVPDSAWARAGRVEILRPEAAVDWLRHPCPGCDRYTLLRRSAGEPGSERGGPKP